MKNNRIVKRLISLVMALSTMIMTITIYPSLLLNYVNLTAYALSNEEITSKLTSLQSVYPSGSYWIPTNEARYGGYQCYAFARQLAVDVFGSYPASDVSKVAEGTVSNGWTAIRNAANVTLEPGDIIRADNNAHSAMIWKIEGNKVYVGQCWGSQNDKINWGTFWGNHEKPTISALLDSGFTGVWKHPDSVIPKQEGLSLTYPNGKRPPEGELKQGNPYGIYGIISDDIEIEDIWATIYNMDRVDNDYPDGFPLLNCSYSVSLKGQGKTSYSLYPEFDNEIIFNDLPVGNYRWEVAAQDARGIVVLENTRFSIVENSSVPSSCGIELSGFQEPQNGYQHTPGKSCGLYGTITSNHTLKSVWGGVYNMNGTPAAGKSTTCTDSANSTSYSLRGKFNDSIIFNDIPDGRYFFSISAEDNDGFKKELIHNVFWVGKPIPQKSELTLNTNQINKGESIAFAATSDSTATNYSLKILKNNAEIISEEMPDGKLTLTFSDAGTYSAYVVSYNGFGHCDSAQISFTVIEPPPEIWHSSLSPANLGDSFDGIILNKKCWKPIRPDDTSNVVLYTEEWRTSEMWRFTRLSNGSYKIENFGNGLCLDVAGSGTADGTTIQTYKSNDTEAQQWFIYLVDDGYVFRPAYSDKVMDLDGNKNDDLTNIHLWSYHGEDAQIFSIYTNGVQNYAKPSPAAPTLTVEGDSSITVSWEQTIYTEQYIIYRSTDNSNWTKLKECDATATSYKDTDLSASTKYYYKYESISRFYKEASPSASASTKEKEPDPNFNGSGTAEDPFQIKTAYDLRHLAELVNDNETAKDYNTAWYIQTADIDLKNKAFEPIGTYTESYPDTAFGFHGHFNGNYKEIKGLYVERTIGYNGLFGWISNGGIIENVSVSGNINCPKAYACGGILGEITTDGTMKNCAFHGTVTGKNSTGGLIGSAWVGGKVQCCYFNGTIANIEGYSGGIIGSVTVGFEETTGSLAIENCYAVGKSEYELCGGIIGSSQIDNPNSIISIKNNYYLNGLAQSGCNGDVSSEGCKKLSAATMKGTDELLGEPFVHNSNESVNGGYPIFEWQQSAVLYGDVNDDKTVDVSDAVLLARFCAEDKDATISTQGRLNADCDGVTGINNDDTIRILKLIAKLVTKEQMGIQI